MAPKRSGPSANTANKKPRVVTPRHDDAEATGTTGNDEPSKKPPPMRSRERPEAAVNAFLLSHEPFPKGVDACLLQGKAVVWTESATDAMKSIFQKDMAIGTLAGAGKASADFASDVMAYPDWIRFSSSGRINTGNGGNSLGNIFDRRDKFPSLEPILRTIECFQDWSPRKTPPQGWIHGKNCPTGSGVTNTHAKHRDRQHLTEVFVEETFGREKNRVRIAVTMNKPTGAHEGRVKETRYAYQGNDVLTIQGELFSFTMMGSRTNGKAPFLEPTGTDGIRGNGDDNALSLLDSNPVLDQDDDDDDNDTTTDAMKHGVYHNGGSFSAMFELTIQDGKVYEFYKALSNCYADYVPTHPVDSVKLVFPVAKCSYQEEKKEEKRVRAAKAFEEGPFRMIQAFINERGHGAISSDVQCVQGKPIDSRLLFLAHKLRARYSSKSLNPHIETLLKKAGFVFNIRLWVAERTLQLMELYCSDGSDINEITQETVVEGFHLGARVIQWKHDKHLPDWMKRPEFKTRLDKIGVDFSLTHLEYTFVKNCKALKEFKLKHKGRDPKGHKVSKEEMALYKFRWAVAHGRRAKFMDQPRFRKMYKEADSAGKPPRSEFFFRKSSK